MTRVGIPGAQQRRLVAAAVVALGLLNMTLAMLRRTPLRIPLIPDEVILEFAVIGSRYLLLASGLTLLALAGGLLHGKHQAWRLAMTAAAVSLVAHSFKRADLVGTGATAAVLLLLMASVRLFPARSDPIRVQQGVRWLLFGELAVFVYGVVGTYALNAEFREPPNILGSFDSALRLLFILPGATIEPVNRHGSWFIDSVRVMALGVLAVAAWHLLHPVIARSVGGGERRRVRTLLEQHATNSLASFHLLEDKQYYVADDGRAFIGYKVVGNVAVALGEPIGAPQSCRAVAASFAEYCDLNGWAFCFYQVTEAGATLLRALGLRALKVGEEAVIPVQRFALSGRHFKHLRNAANRLARAGYRVEQLPQPIDESTLAELRAVSDAWIALGRHRERSFTLGAFDPDYLHETEVFVVRAADGRIEAFANVIPSFRSAEGNFDLMRYRPDAADGVIDYLCIFLVELFKQRGCTGMNLGFAPLSGIEGAGLAARALRLLYEHGGRAFNFQGLRAFKDKWQPVWQPRYLVYRSDLLLPQLALAVARAGERDERPAWTLLGRLRRHRRPASSCPPAAHGGDPFAARPGWWSGIIPLYHRVARLGRRGTPSRRVGRTHP